MATKNSTLSLPEELVRRVKVEAARHVTSVSALVGGLIESAVGRVDDDAEVWAREADVMASGIMRMGSIDWDRDEVHDRRR